MLTSSLLLNFCMMRTSPRNVEWLKRLIARTSAALQFDYLLDLDSIDSKIISSIAFKFSRSFGLCAFFFAKVAAKSPHSTNWRTLQKSNGDQPSYLNIYECAVSWHDVCALSCVAPEWKWKRKCLISFPSSGGSIRSSSPEPVAQSEEYSNLKYEDLKFIATLGMGGFGRVELVSQW